MELRAEETNKQKGVDEFGATEFTYLLESLKV